MLLGGSQKRENLSVTGWLEKSKPGQIRWCQRTLLHGKRRSGDAEVLHVEEGRNYKVANQLRTVKLNNGVAKGKGVPGKAWGAYGNPSRRSEC